MTITFTVENGVIFKTPMGVETAVDGFSFGSSGPRFMWRPVVTIHGSRNDPFSDWQVGHHQAIRGFWLNIYWGFGTNQTHRRGHIDPLPQRDALRGNWPFYDMNAAHIFSRNGEMVEIPHRDSPILPGSYTSSRFGPLQRFPWSNPRGRPGDRGSFNFGSAFTVTLSAHRVSSNVYQHLSHVHWNFSISGYFDSASGGRIYNVVGGNINVSGPQSGFDRANAPIIGRDEAINHLHIADA